MPAEVEAKFRAADRRPLDALAASSRLGDASLGPPATVAEIDRYVDTADHRLAALGWACRMRRRGAVIRVSLKGANRAATPGSIQRRRELEAPATESLDPADWPESEARSLVEQLAAGWPLVERFELQQERTEREVRLAGRLVGTLSLDVVVVAHDSRRFDELFVVELELADAADRQARADLDRLADALEKRPGLAVEPSTKLEHALRLLAR